VINGTRYTVCPTLQRFLHISLFRLFNTLVSSPLCPLFYLSHTQLGFSLYPYTRPCSLIPTFLVSLGNIYRSFSYIILNNLSLRCISVILRLSVSYVESTEAFVGSYTWEVIVLASVYTQHQTFLLLDIRNNGGWRGSGNRNRSRLGGRIDYTIFCLENSQ
jgi:hypothetical protein